MILILHNYNLTLDQCEQSVLIKQQDARSGVHISRKK